MSNVLWKINIVNNKSDLGVHLRCVDAKRSFSGKVTFTLKLVSGVGKEFDITRSTTRESGKRLFHNSWGWSEFVSLAELNNETKGYLMDGKVKIEVDAKIVKELPV